ncbi:MAG: hypothetical protein M3Y04_10105, partial [Actinomycetota bacterium]|nr:hypothetical protein [Actinomycetota bacterium]
MPLSRREFLLGGLGAGAAGAAGLLVSRHDFGTRAVARTGPTGTTAAGGVAGTPGKDGILVLLTLYGGNDGLNTLIPYQDGSYLGGRRTLGYQPQEV